MRLCFCRAECRRRVACDDHLPGKPRGEVAGEGVGGEVMDMELDMIKLSADVRATEARGIWNF
jgi:hypothetical protein